MRIYYVLFILVMTYSMLFYGVMSKRGAIDGDIHPLMSLNALKVIAGPFGKQFLSHSLYIKAAVYYGGNIEKFNNSRLPVHFNDDNLNILYDYFYKMTSLNPVVLDFYYRSQAILSNDSRNKIQLKNSNNVLLIGALNIPDSITIPFFQGYNYRLLDDSDEAAKVLFRASNIEGAPSWIKHLAISMKSKGGGLKTSLIWLQGMYNSTDKGPLKDKYGLEIKTLKYSIYLQKQINYYKIIDIEVLNEKKYEYNLTPIINKIERNGFKIKLKNGKLSIYRGFIK